MDKLQEKLKYILNICKEWCIDLFDYFRTVYGIAGFVVLALVAAKYIVFYNLMSVKSSFVLVCIVSYMLTYYLFASFRNKYIPAVIYLIFSVLMFADVTYCSFFNKYLSIAMIGSAGMLGDITESIKEVLRPINFFMMLDAVAIFAVIFLAGKKGNRNDDEDKNEQDKDLKKKQETLTERIKSIKFEKTPAAEEGKPRDILAELDAMALEEEEEMIEVEDIDLNLQKKPSAARRVARKQQERKKKQRELKNFCVDINKVIPLCMIAVLVFVGSFSPFVQSVSKQEFFTYHVGDVVTEAFGLSGKKYIKEFEDTYMTEKEGPLFGIGKDRNLVVIQIESFQNFLIGLEYNGQEITPFLNSLIENDSVYFDNYFQQVGTGNTSDAEFATNNSIMGSIESFTYQLYENNYFRGLPWLLKEQGYETAVLHAHESRDFWNRQDIYPNLGFDHYYGGLIGDTARPGGNFYMTEWMGWGLTDSEFYPQAMGYIRELKEPFYSFIITLSNHHPYEMLEKYSFIDLKPEDEGTLAGNYINSAAYTDYALSQLFELFKKEGLYENTVFALYGDHMGLSADEETDKVMKRILGHDYDWDDRMNIPLIIHIPDADGDVNGVNHNYGGQMDFLPTIAYIMGLESLDTVYLGHNLFTYEDGVVAEHAYMPYGSFFTKGYGFEMSRDGVFKNGRVWNRETREESDTDGFYDAYMRSREISDTSVYILQNDILRKVYEEGKSREEVFE